MAPAFASLARPVLNVIRGRPILAVFEVTLRCNSACGYCDLPLNRGRYELTREDIRRVFAGLYREGLRFLFVQGGEPLLRRDLPEILEDLHELGFGLTLITNGTRLTPSLIRRLAALPLNLSVSLDTLDRERYRWIRGADQLVDVVEGIGLLQDFPHPKYLTIIASEANRDEVEAMVRFAKAHGFMPVVGAYHWGIERYGKAEAGLQYDRRMLAGVFERVLESGLVPRGYFRDYLRDNVRWLSGGALDRCDAGRYSIAIDASGNVAPCLALAHAGNLLQSSLDDILACFDRLAITNCSNRSSCNMLCSRVVGSVLRHPLSALLTPRSVQAQVTT
ncbi:MAG: radical SAM protein [Nitrospirota bacterium]|nr:radical SAM protein [Nitrospirota bacterium]